MVCPRCGAENAASRKFCRDCGAALAPACPACAARNEPGDRFCGECGAALAPAPATEPAAQPAPLVAEPPPPDLAASAEEERRLVTVLFADLVGFTTLSERLDPEDVREITTECLRRLVAEVVRYEGTVEKFIGDAVMAVFGAPLAHEDDPLRALRAALAMQRALEALNRDLERDRGLRLALRIGVQSGEVVAGVRQVGDIRVFSVNGDAVNVAARLQAATPPGTILVGQATASRAAGAFDLRPVPPVELKGKEQPVAAAILLGPRAETPPEERTPLVGREAELQALTSCLAELRRGRGQIAIVVGDPGLGKSRLLAELRSQGDGLAWVRCQAFAHEQSLSHGVARTLVRALCDLDVEAPEPQAVDQLRVRAAGLGCAEAEPALAHLLMLPLDPTDAQALAALSPQELQRRTFAAIADLASRRALDQPLVLELDDLHWADPSSVDLLLELLRLADQAPLLLCIALRPERDAPAWALRERAARDFPHRSTEVSLAPLPDTACAELAARLLGTDALPPGLLALLERAAGTPLWVEEIVRTLVERGLIEADGGGWHATADLARAEIPASLQALIIARIDRLQDARPTLQTASVIGRRFGRRVLERVASPEPRLDEHLLAAQRVDLVRELQAIPEHEYGFKHVLTQEAAYATLLLRRRRELHRRVAESLEALYPERLDELHATLAHHYHRAEAWDRALEHARAAAAAARASYANREALEAYSLALEAAERSGLGPSVPAELREARAAVHELLGEFEPARADYEAALACAEASGDRLARARILGALGMLWGGHQDYQRGLELTARAVAAAAEAGDRRAEAAARLRLGVMQFNLGRAADSRAELEGALALFRALADEPGQAQALDVLTMASLCLGEPTHAVEYGEEAIRRLEALGDRATAATSMAMLGQALAYLGDRPAAVARVSRAIEIWAEMGVRHGEAFGHMGIAQSAEPFGDYDAAFRAASTGLAIAREIDHREWTAASLAFLGRVHRRCGDPRGARALHEEMLALARELGTTLWTAYALGELAQDFAQVDGPAAAEPLLLEAIATGGELHLFTAPALLAQAELHLSAGRPAEALAAARAFQSKLPQFRVFAADARRIEGEAMLALGRPDEAEPTLRQARAEAAALDALPPFWRAGHALGQLLEHRGQAEAAATEYAAVLTALERVAASLSDDHLRQAFLESEPVRDAREAVGRLSG